jgi:hypothetical protein
MNRSAPVILAMRIVPGGGMINSATVPPTRFVRALATLRRIIEAKTWAHHF